MKKLIYLAAILLLIILISQWMPEIRWEDQASAFLRNNLGKVMHWVNLSAIA